MGLTPATQNQVPEHSILDYFNKQTYLGNAFSFPIGPETINSTNETPIALILNPALAAGVAFPNQKALFQNLRTTASDIASGDGTTFFRYYLNPTIATQGTKTTPINCRPASATTSIASCYVNGQFTVSSNGTLARVITAGYSSINDSNLLFILDPGQSLLVTAQPVTSGATIINANSWYEL
jgi:hypothetical protein